MSPLQSIPPKVRATLYWAGYVLGVISQGITIVWAAVAAASPDVEMPLALVIASAVLALLQTQLNLLAGSNLPSYVDVIEGEVAPPVVPDERGATDLQAVLIALLIVLVALVIVALLSGGISLR